MACVVRELKMRYLDLVALPPHFIRPFYASAFFFKWTMLNLHWSPIYFSHGWCCEHWVLNIYTYALRWFKVPAKKNCARNQRSVSILTHNQVSKPAVNECMKRRWPRKRENLVCNFLINFNCIAFGIKPRRNSTKWTAAQTQQAYVHLLACTPQPCKCAWNLFWIWNWERRVLNLMKNHKK